MTDDKNNDAKKENGEDNGAATPDRTAAPAGSEGVKPSGEPCDRAAVKSGIEEKISAAKLEAEVTDLEELLKAIEKAEKSYDEKFEALEDKDEELCSFSNSSLETIKDKAGGNLSDADITKIKAIVKEAVDEVLNLRKCLAGLKGVMPAKIADEAKFKFGSVAKARITLDEAKADHETKTNTLKELCDLAGAISAKHGKLEKMAAEIAKRIAGPRENATFGTAWWLITQGDQSEALAKQDFFDGLLCSDPTVIDPECLAKKIEEAWADEADAKANVYRATSALKKQEDDLKKVEKDLADAEANLIKKIIKEIEAWDCIRPGFPSDVEEC